MWAFLPEERARARIDQSESESKRIAWPSTHFILHPAAPLHGTRSGRSLKKCVFGCEGKLTLFSFPRNPALHKQWMQFVFPGQQRSFLNVFVDERSRRAISRSSAFLRKNRKAVSFFINMIKLNTFWRYEGCSTNLLVLKINLRLVETVFYAPFNIFLVKMVAFLFYLFFK